MSDISFAFGYLGGIFNSLLLLRSDSKSGLCKILYKNSAFRYDSYIFSHVSLFNKTDFCDTVNRYIMQYLTKKTGGSIHDNETIEINSNSIFQNDNSYHPKNLVDCDEPSFVCFDFKDKSV